MRGRLRRSRSLARQLAGMVLVIALLLQGMAVAFAVGRMAAAAGGARDWAGFELCRHGGAAQPGGGPASPASGGHCIFCPAGQTIVLGAPVHAPAFHTIVIAIVPWKRVAWRLPAPRIDASARPRGPPPAA